MTVSDMAITPGRHIPALDGLRGVAVLGVVAHHLGHLTGGYLGVDAFFVLSGFLITGLLLDEIGRTADQPAAIDLGRFWMRRARRLLPAFFLMLATVVVVERWVLDDGVSEETLRVESLSALAYVFNWQAIFNDVDYWTTFAAVSPLRHMWSLAIEEQFYLVWPLVVTAVVWWALRRQATAGRAQAAVAVVAGCLAVASVATQWALYAPERSLRVYYGTDTRVAAILFGCVAAFIVRRVPTLSVRVQHWLGAGAALLLIPVAWAWIELDGTSPTLYHGGLAAVGLATAVVIAIAALAPKSLLATVLSFSPLLWFGAISYGLYLWHWPIIVWLTPARVGLHGWPLMVLRLGVALVVTMLSYHLVEQPIRRAHWSDKRTAGWVVPALVALGVLTVGATVGAAPSAAQPAAGSRSTEPIPTRPPTTPSLDARSPDLHPNWYSRFQ